MKKHDLLIAALISIIFLTASLSYLNAGLFHMDSIELAKTIEKSFEDKKIYGVAGGRYLYVIVNNFGYGLAKNFFQVQNSELTLKIINSLFAAFAIFFMYFFTKELVNRKIAIFSSLLFAFNPLFFSMSTYPKDHLFGVAFCLCAGFLYLNGLRRNLIIHRAAASLIVGLSIFLRFTNIFFSLFLLLLILLKLKQDDKLKTSIIKKEALIFFTPLIIIFILYLIIQYSSVSLMSLSNPSKLFINLEFQKLIGLFWIVLTPIGFFFIDLWDLERSFKTSTNQFNLIILDNL